MLHFVTPKNAPYCNIVTEMCTCVHISVTILQHGVLCDTGLVRCGIGATGLFQRCGISAKGLFDKRYLSHQSLKLTWYCFIWNIIPVDQRVNWSHLARVRNRMHILWGILYMGEWVISFIVIANIELYPHILCMSAQFLFALSKEIYTVVEQIDRLMKHHCE